MKILCVLLLTINLYSYSALDIILNKDIDLESKSIKGWIRLFNNPDKLKLYGYTYTEYERIILLEYFKEIQIDNDLKYSRRIK